MGFFKKIFKGIKKVVKKIGRGIKKVIGKVGKFMNKIGIVGQIAMAFILPGIGTMLGQALGGLGSFGTALAGSTNFLAKAAGTIIKGAAHVASKVGHVFRTVSNAVGNYVGEFAKTAASKLGFNIESAATNFFGAEGAFAKAASATGETWRAGFGSIEAVSKASTEVVSSMVSETTSAIRRPLEQITPTAEGAGFKVEVPDSITQAIKKPTFDTGIVKEAGKKGWKAEDLFGKDISKLTESVIDPEMGLAQTRELVAEEGYGALAKTAKPKFSSEMTAEGVSQTARNVADRVIEERGTSLLGRMGDNITAGFVNAKDRAAANIQTGIDDMIADPLGTAWKGAKALAGVDGDTDPTSPYYAQDMTGLLTQTNITDFQATAMQTPYYGYTATLYDRFGYVPKSTWAKTMQGLV